MMDKFWWVRKEVEKRIHWRSWLKIGDPNQIGGMWFRDIKHFNKALLAQ